ncbi:T9SS type A sorting domain-containing protein [Chryseobacterium fluminis]|uniref:T9SS type A sorting domain-containing protein n=1 Tax=Chryseobacterium fluminis TaxID=2983606 RepID=UPI002251ACFC|nr:T9SS type A sorting domain-containing protein [Chryseobacterium sp. MMS21-Ot14]UZT96307.1 T9SS type A sorting domain-containing protein [Chryseobacterium sp. MMS21-Ot14]
MKLVFELRKEKINKNGSIPIQLTIRNDGIRIRKNTGLTVLENHWTGHRVKPNLKKETDNNYQLINDDLQRIEEKVSKIFLYLLSIYPNPIKNGEYLYLNKKVNEILIYNSEGRLINKSNLKSNSILIDNLLEGIYFLKTENMTHKFIVN